MIDIRQWATPTQIKYLNAVDKHGSARAAARALGLNKSTISKAIKRAKREAARHGYSPEHDMTRTVPDGYKVRGVSTYYNRDGKPTGQWVKSAIDAERQREIMLEAWQGMADELPRLQPVRPSGVYNDKLMTVYPLGDPHIGMLSWGEETGADFDLQIATANLCGSDLAARLW